MTLEFEKLTADLEKMSRTAVRRYQQRAVRIETALQTLNKFATSWTHVTTQVARGRDLGDEKVYRTAIHLDEAEPLNAAINPSPSPKTAVIVAADGSQIMPDRHAAFLYYLINIGGIIYFHGSGDPPQVFTVPTIEYPESDEAIASFPDSSGQVSILRDIEEIGTLVQTAWRFRTEPPVIAILDQRLLYWPIGDSGSRTGETAVRKWQTSMTEARENGTLLVGYIERSRKSALVQLTHLLRADDNPNFDWKKVGTAQGSEGLTDLDIFETLLNPGQRSKIFVDVSPPNDRFRDNDAKNEVCFFYLHTGGADRPIARIDLPRSVAENSVAVEVIHSLLVDQCALMGGYPYVLARADEMAVVGRQDQAELDFMIDIFMQRQGISAAITGKQAAKNAARGGRSRHGL